MDIEKQKAELNEKAKKLTGDKQKLMDGVQQINTELVRLDGKMQLLLEIENPEGKDSIPVETKKKA